MFRKPAQPITRPEAFVEELFLQRYEQMLEWALHLTDHRAAQAEDLVHDAFVQLTLSPPDFKTIENLDGYLFVVLRNLHRSQMQRAMRGPTGPESLVDYDSAVASLKSADPREHWQAVEELQQVCHYACLRKESSKAGSALILRFFHGYYPGEVAAILCVSRPAIKELLRMARGEAKLFLDDPAKLSFFSEVTNSNAAEIKPGSTLEETTTQLRQPIFAARTGACLNRKHLAELYEAARPELLTVPLLAHLVSCPNCLEEANRLLGLPPLSDRDPNDMLGPDRGAQASGIKPKLTVVETSAKARQRRLKKYRQRLREVYEHEPQELRIAVNGFVLARQEVNSELTRQTLGIEVAEQLTLIEVFSEQGVRLLALHVAPPPDGQFEQRARAELSHGRTMNAVLSFCGSWPHLEITYECGVRSAECGVEERCVLPSLFFPVEDETSPAAQGFLAHLKSAISNPQSAIKWFLRPVTITILLTLLLLTVVVGQKLGWWFAPAKPAVKPAPRAVPPVAAPREAVPAATPANSSVIPNVAMPSPMVSPSALAATATAEMEVEALRLFHDAGADLGEQIEIRRTPQGKLKIEGIVETSERKAELTRALASFAAHPAVILQLETVAEAVARQRKSNPLASAAGELNHVEIEKTALPIANELRAYLQRRGSDASETAIHELAARLHAQTHRALNHLYALERLTKQIPLARFDQLDPVAQSKYRTVLAQHAQAYATKTRHLREELATILNVSAPAADAQPEIRHNAELYRAIAQLFALGKSAAAVLDQSLTISNQPTAVTAIKSSSFWRALTNAEALVAQIEHFTRQHQTTEREQ
jgi:RNA polymerase sigma factor (sigma-70 family)